MAIKAELIAYLKASLSQLEGPYITATGCVDLLLMSRFVSPVQWNDYVKLSREYREAIRTV